MTLSNYPSRFIKYFTARVKPYAHKPYQAVNQQLYLRALRTLSNLEIIYGRFLSHEVSMPLANPPKGGSRLARVIKTEEKGSDVNLATHLLWDGFVGRYEAAAVVTNDSDLAEPIRVVRRELKRDVIVLNPYGNDSAELKQVASYVKRIRQGPLALAQFPATLHDHRGAFSKPPAW